MHLPSVDTGLVTVDRSATAAGLSCTAVCGTRKFVGCPACQRTIGDPALASVHQRVYEMQLEWRKMWSEQLVKELNLLQLSRRTCTVQREDNKSQMVGNPATLRTDWEVLKPHTKELDHESPATKQTSVAWEASGSKVGNAVGKQLNTRLEEEASPRLTLLQQQLAQESRAVRSLSELRPTAESKLTTLQGLPSHIMETLRHVSCPSMADYQAVVDGLQNKLQLTESHIQSLAEEIGFHEEAALIMRSAWTEDLEMMGARHNEQTRQLDRLVDRLQQELDERTKQLREADLDYTIEKQKMQAGFDAELRQLRHDNLKDHGLRQIQKQLNQAKMEPGMKSGSLRMEQINSTTGRHQSFTSSYYMPQESQRQRLDRRPY